MATESTSDVSERIRRALERSARAVELRPGHGQGTAVTTVRLGEGTTCQITDGSWTLTADTSESYGGSGEGPDPGVLGRAGLGSCLAVGYRQWAARRGVPIQGLTVRVEADYDARAELGVTDDLSPAYARVRVIVTVESEASEEEVAAVLDEADSHSPWLAVFREPVEVSREWSLREPGS